MTSFEIVSYELCRVFDCNSTSVLFHLGMASVLYALQFVRVWVRTVDSIRPFLEICYSVWCQDSLQLSHFIVNFVPTRTKYNRKNITGKHKSFQLYIVHIWHRWYCNWNRSLIRQVKWVSVKLLLLLLSYRKIQLTSFQLPLA